MWKEIGIYGEGGANGQGKAASRPPGSRLGRRRLAEEAGHLQIGDLDLLLNKIHSLIANFLIGLAGTPATMMKGGTLLFTTEPAPTMAPLPIVTLGRTITPVPSQASSFIVIGP